MNPYHILGAPPDAEVEILRAAYRRLVRVHHPDRATDEAARRLATERMVQINWAWHLLSDPARRADFDARWRAQQLERARRQQELLRNQANQGAARARQAQLADVLQAQGKRERPQAAPQARAPWANERQYLEWQALERERQQRQMQAKQAAQTRSARPRLTRAEKKREAQARARLRQREREDKKRSSSPSARRQLAQAAHLFSQQGRASDAIAICHDVLRVDNRNVPARELLGDFYLRLGRQDRALPLWEQALMLQPGNSSLRRKLNSLRPHDTTSYDPQPRIPRPAPTARRQDAATEARPIAERDGFWSRLRGAFCDDL